MSIFSFFKKSIPLPIRHNLRDIRKFFRYNYRRLIIVWPVFRNKHIKIIVGAAETKQKAWYSTNEQWLDITNASDWLRVFRKKKLLTHVVAEHVFEHLTPDECELALKNIYDYMLDNGRLRIAVPDGYHPEPEYIKHVGINGIGADASDHKQLLNVDSLLSFLKNAGFQPVHIEGYRKDGVLVQQPVRPEDGFISRSRFNVHNKYVKDGWDFVDSETSLIVDGVK